MSGVNRVILLGRLGNDPDLRHTSTGVPVCKFSLATSEVWFDKKGEKQEETTWHKVVVWQKPAENCAKYLSKGRQVYIEGKITTVTWDDKQTGQKRYGTEIVAQTVQFIGDGQQQQQQARPAQQQGYDQGYDFGQVFGPAATPGLDEIPF